jgi:anaerobic ribonucleoside-triphosphate reductase activating protein
MPRIAGIEHNSTVDGEGWREAIFFQGCNHHCLGCHNPQTWDFNAGKEISNEELLNIINKSLTDNALIDGITLTGGDPFFQSEDILGLCEQLKQMGLNIWAYTGFRFDEFLHFIKSEKHDSRITQSMIDLLKFVDVVVDGQFILAKKTIEIPYVGSSNQRLIDVKKTLNSMEITEYTLD